MKIFINNFFYDVDLSPFYFLLETVFNENIQIGELENSNILLESVFGSDTALYKKKWSYSFLFIGESDRRLPIFIESGLKNGRLKDYSCILKGKSENDNNSVNVINFPLFVFYNYCFDFTYKFVKYSYDESRFNKIVTNKITNIPLKNVCVIMSNSNDSEGRNFFIEELEKKVNIDYAGNYKNNVQRVEYSHCSPGFIDFVSKYKIIISMENSKNNNYITEKILHGFSANTIPVYWGADNIGDYFNKDRFINVKSFNMDDINQAIDKIQMILNDDDSFIEIVNKPIYVNNFCPLTLSNIAANIKTLLNIENKQLKKFITFGGPTANYHSSVERICKEAESLKYFDEIKGFTDNYLKNDKTFWEKHGNFIENNPRGYGYWIWKSYLIKKELEAMKENDILIHCDAGCQINSNGKQRINEYIDMLNTDKKHYGLISFQLEFKNVQYTKKAIFDRFESSENEKNMLQCVGGIVVIKKNKHSINIVDEWYNNCQDYNLINDVVNCEDENFIENRHDQSIISVLVNKYGSIKLLDETYFHPNWENDGFCYPFWAKRIK